MWFHQINFGNVAKLLPIIIGIIVVVGLAVKFLT